MAIRKQLLDKYKELPQMERYEILDKIKQLKSLRNQALVCFLYLTGCRVEEVVKFIKEKNPHRIVKRDDQWVKAPIENRSLIGLPIQKKQIEIEDDNLTIRNVRCLKRKTMVRRSIPILFKDKEMSFINILQSYLNGLQEDDYLFPITRTRAYQILSKIGLFPHYLRHIRMTHLVVDYNFSSGHLKKFTGWSDSKTADDYVHLSVDDLLDKMRSV